MPRKLIALFLLVALISVILTACGGSDADSLTAVPPTVITLQDPSGSGSYTFSQSELTFSVGETVNFTLIAEGEFHTFTVDELGIDQDVGAGETVTLTFTFDTPGTFELICIPHELLGMVGTLTVQ